MTQEKKNILADTEETLMYVQVMNDFLSVPRETLTIEQVNALLMIIGKVENLMGVAIEF